MLQSNFLPADFTPSKNEIIVGRGKQVLHHQGNKKLRLLVQAEIAPYAAAKNRAAKTAIITRIFNIIMADTTVGFVKRHAPTKRYFKMEYTASKTTIAQYFRDALADNYKSSKKYKQQLRDAVKEDAPPSTAPSFCSGSALVSPVPSLMAQQIREVSSCGSTSDCNSAPFPGLPKPNDVAEASFPLFRMARAPPLPHISFSGVKDMENFGDLRTILSSASAMIDTSEDLDYFDGMPDEWEDTAVDNHQPSLFAALYHSFCADLDCSSNPFEPTPLPESV